MHIPGDYGKDRTAGDYRAVGSYGFTMEAMARTEPLETMEHDGQASRHSSRYLGIARFELDIAIGMGHNGYASKFSLFPN